MCNIHFKACRYRSPCRQEGSTCCYLLWSENIRTAQVCCLHLVSCPPSLWLWLCSKGGSVVGSGFAAISCTTSKSM